MSQHENETARQITAPASPRPGSSLHYAALLMPSRQRRAGFALLRLWLNVASIPMSISDPGVAETKLRWWAQEWARATDGTAQHPQIVSLAEALRTTATPWPDADLWHSQIEAWVQLAHQNRWLNQDALDQHLNDSTGKAARMAALVLGARSEAAQAAAHRLGVGLRRAHLLARLGQDARAGWIMVGIDRLQHHDVKAHQISKPGRPAPDGFDALVKEMATAAHTDLRNGWSAVQALTASERRALLPLLALARCASVLLQEITRSGDAVLHQRLVLTPARKSWLCWQTRWGWGALPH